MRLSDFDAMLAIGPTLCDRRAASARMIAEGAHHFATRAGTRVAVVASLETSDVAELVDADVLVGFDYRVGPPRLKCVCRGSERESFCPMHGDDPLAISSKKIINLVLSFRARGNYDVGALAQSIDGGGHRAAAGATILSIDDASPYLQIERIIARHEVLR